MDFWLFVVILVIFGLAALAGFIGMIRTRHRSLRRWWLLPTVLGLVVLTIGLAGIINPRVEATDRIERGYFTLAELEATSLNFNPYVIQYHDATEFRFYQDEKTPVRYRTVKGEYVELEFMTASEIAAGYAPTVRVMQETDRKIYPFFIWSVKAPDSTVKTGVIRFYLTIPQDKLVIY